MSVSRGDSHNRRGADGNLSAAAAAIGLAVVAFTTATARPTHAGTFELAEVFGSGMVLQQAQPVRIWGRADTGDRVSVSFGDDTASVTTDERGHWIATLPARQASSEPESLVVCRDQDRRQLDNLLVGEVWLAAGQSNMLLPLAKAEDASREIAAAERPTVRLLMLEAAAGGDRRRYTPAQIAALEPSRFFRGSWQPCTPQTAVGFSAVGSFFGASLADQLGVPVGVICVAVGGSPTEAWVRRGAIAADPALAAITEKPWLDNPAVAGWCSERARLQLAGVEVGSLPGDASGPNHPFKPGFLWEAGIAPLVPLAIRGVVWYQGESNAESPDRVAQHTPLLSRLITDWRRAWNRPRLPFGVVQLPGMQRPSWPAFRESQRRLAESLPGVGLVVTLDLGLRSDVHPPDKRPIGERLARWAAVEVYGREGTSTGPVPERAFCREGSIVVRFRDTPGGLATTDGKPPRHFAVRRREGVFQPADATIEGDSVRLETTMPAAEVAVVGYGQAGFPEPPVNLTDTSGLPATPFLLEIDQSQTRSPAEPPPPIADPP